MKNFSTQCLAEDKKVKKWCRLLFFSFALCCAYRTDWRKGRTRISRAPALSTRLKKKMKGKK